MDRKLANQIDTGLVSVDVANVCRDHRLPGEVSLQRLELMLIAWRTQISRHAEFHLVADRSLLGDFSRHDKRQAKQMRRAGVLFVHPKADAPLLVHAETHGGSVLSRDRFLDARRERSWVPERFFTWEIGDSVQIVRQGSRNTQAFDVSRKLEQKLAQAQGLSSLGHPTTKRRWACVSEVPCLTRESAPDFLRVLPVLELDVALCPGCRQPLRDLGMRPSEAELKVVADERTLARFTVRQGERVAFGRLILPNTTELAELAQQGAFAGVGRVHADLRLSGKRVAVRPVDDRHPVALCRWDSRRRRLGREQELRHADGFTAIGLRDTLLIGNRLELVRSGRSIAEAEELSENSDASPWRFHSTAGPKQKTPPAAELQGAEGEGF
jgi:hypothetical protein